MISITDFKKSEVVEKIFVNTSKDSKHKLNLSSETVPIELLDNIEKNGITLEELKNIKFPVCTYITQITIHGIFPELKFNRIGTYKNIIQNKNKSVGIKYTGVDYLKKRTIREYSRYIKWNYQYNSSEFFLYKFSKFANNKEELIESYNKLKEIASNINTDLFIGGVSCNLYKSIYGVFVGLVVYINAVPEENLKLLIGNLGNKSFEEIELIKVNEEKRREEEHKKWQEEYEKEKKNQELTKEKIKSEIENKFGVMQEIKESGVYISGRGFFSGNIEYVIYDVYKNKGDRLFRYKKYTGNTIEKCIEKYNNKKDYYTYEEKMKRSFHASVYKKEIQKIESVELDKTQVKVYNNKTSNMVQCKHCLHINTNNCKHDSINYTCYK